jgi:phospholipid/cholesterol/gamma-HCH transport system substrate-binding protein
VLGRADDAMQTVENFLLVNEPFLTQTIADVNLITGTIASQSDAIEQLMQGVGAIATEISGLSGRLEGIISGSEALLAAVEPQSVAEVVENIRVGSTAFRTIGEDAQALVARADSVFDTLEGSAQSLSGALEAIEDVVSAVDPAMIRQAVSDVGAFTATLPDAGTRVENVLSQAESASANVTSFTQSLEANAQRMDSIFADAELIAERLEVASRRIDAIMEGVDGLLGADETSGLISDARDAARALRNVAVAFEGRADGIAGGLERFSTRGLQDVEALVGDGRQLLTRIDRVVSSLERNPQQLIFGDGASPEYSPQRR